MKFAAALVSAAAAIAVASTFVARHETTQETARVIETVDASQECRAKLRDIEEGKMSGDDQLVINDCLLNGRISDAEIQRAYKKAIERAKG